MGWLQTLTAEFTITISNQMVWLSIAQGLVFGSVTLMLGIWVARTVGLLERRALAGETLAVGLASGLLVLAAWWAAISSGGRSSFTPVAVGFALAIALAVLRPARANDGTISVTSDPPETVEVAQLASRMRSSRRRALGLAALGGAAFITAVALLYGSTMALSPRDGVQPLEFMDEAYYSILGDDLARTGTESVYSPSGFHELDGLPSQTWYHWGELWLASGVIKVFGTEPVLARHFIVLPVLLLAAAALTGTLVRRMSGTSSRGAYLFGFFVCLFLAPVPLASGSYFSSWAVGLIFGITVYGLAAIAVLLAMYSIAVLATRKATWALTGFVGSAAAMILPAHLVIALLAAVGVVSVCTMWIARSLMATGRMPRASVVWSRTFAVTATALIVTVAWGLLTGHGLGGSGLSTSVSSFNASWRDSVAITILGAGAFFAIAVGWFLARKDSPVQAGMFAGTAVLLVSGAVAWGARLGDFNMFHVFFGGIAVFATPATAVAVWAIWMRLRAAGRPSLAVATLLISIAQMEFGVGLGIIRLQQFGPGTYAPVPMEVLAAIRNLPQDAKLAYSCGRFEELAFWDARLLGLDAHTRRRIVPMCFQAEFFGLLTGTQVSADIPSPLFQWAPQRSLYPDSGARPSSESVTSFMKDHGIDYIYADAMHPNSIWPDAIPIVTRGEVQVLRIP